ncbi:hypothetical protein CS542_04745 [Pedobacter sp. IW39]|nr:hypothetical protein CS542_04745 [Pedobacter sp. IW39]
MILGNPEASPEPCLNRSHKLAPGAGYIMKIRLLTVRLQLLHRNSELYFTAVTLSGFTFAGTARLTFVGTARLVLTDCFALNRKNCINS